MQDNNIISVPAQNHPIYERQRNPVSGTIGTDHRLYQGNTRFFDKLKALVPQDQF